MSSEVAEIFYNRRMNNTKGAQDQDFRDTLTPRFETPTPNEKKKQKAEG